MDVLIYLVVLIGFMIVVLAKKKVNDTAQKNGMEYDERQIRARGEAYKYGYFTALLYFSATVVINELLGKQWCDYSVSVFLGVGLSILVFVCVCIWKDAYVSFRSSSKQAYFIVVVVGLLNLFIGIQDLFEHGITIVNNQVQNLSSNLLVGVLFTIVILVAGLKYMLDKREQE